MQKLTPVYTGSGFATGTLVQTERGEIPVETLEPGDLVLTKFGGRRPVRTISSGRSAGDRAVSIPANGIGDGVPKRDCLVSSDQAICVKVVTDALIAVESLTYKSTFQLVPTEGDFWQVHLDADDVILAEGLAFQSGPDIEIERITDRHLIEIIRAILKDRAPALGWQLEDSPPLDLHLVVDGRRVDPVAKDLSFRFLVPAATTDLWIVCEASAPNKVGVSLDNRLLGACVSAMRIEDGFSKSQHVPLDHPLLSTGFHSFEGSHRWTDGCALLHPDLWQHCLESFFLTLTLGNTGLPRYCSPQRDTDRAR